MRQHRHVKACCGRVGGVSQLTGLVVCLGACVHPQSTHTPVSVEMHGFITLAVFADTYNEEVRI